MNHPICQVRQCLRKVICVFESPDLAYPVPVHCTSGKDRTGVMIATLLKILDIPDNLINEEYLLSEGGVDAAWIQSALEAIGDPASYFASLNLDRIRAHLTAG